MIIDTPDPQTAHGYTADVFQRDLDDDGFVFSHTRAMAVNPEALAAFEGLVHTIVPSIGVRLYELVTLAAAAALKSPHCLLAHGRKTLRAEALDEDALVLVLHDFENAGLSDADVAAMRYAQRLSTDAESMTDDDTAALRDAGFTDRQIVDITLAAAARNYFSRSLEALAVPVEEELNGISPRVRDALLSPLTR